MNASSVVIAKRGAGRSNAGITLGLASTSHSTIAMSSMGTSVRTILIE
ncbi:hypothetical protein H0A65_07660 [Alcaligenaceae bacterium]|nr:hypothetical protein [Alcaligenaceae bacterium]